MKANALDKNSPGTAYEKLRTYFPTFLPEPKPRKKILMVEDEAPLAEITRLCLKQAGFDVEIAETIHAAHHRLQEKCPDAVLLDINLPDGDGLELLEKLKQQHPKVPALIFTSEGYNEGKMQIAHTKGASGFISKMMGQDSILAAIHNVLPRQA